MSRHLSVRTRHLAVISFLITLITVSMLCFSVVRLLEARIESRKETVERLADQLFALSQKAINSRPFEDPETAIGLDESVRSLIKTTTLPGTNAGKNKDFVYCSVISVKDGSVIVKSDPDNLFKTQYKPVNIDELNNANFIKQLWMLFNDDKVFEVKTTIQLSNKPFAEIVAGIQTANLRASISPYIKLSVILGIFAILICGAFSIWSANIVLSPLREVMESIEQLEAEALTDKRDGSPDMQTISQRLRELGRRFAGNRNEIETIRDQLKQIVGNLTERVLLLDRDKRVIMASPDAEKMLCGGYVSIKGQRLNEVLNIHHPILTLTDKAYALGHSLEEIATLEINGTQAPHRVIASLQLFQDRGQAAGALITLRDFETFKRLETELDFANKLAALNRITAGVAHEVKNPLHAMVLHLELLGAKLDAGLDPKSHVDILMSEVNRLKRVVQTFLDFTRPVDLKFHQLDSNTLVREVIMLAADARAQGIDLEERYASGPLHIKADSDILKQALLNIIINGCQVMPDGGKLIIQTGRENDHIYIAITDQGPGIPENLREKIFNLYYTTKPKGSGIGLAQAFRAVQLHNGRIIVESNIGSGTCFKILLPNA